MAVRFEIRKASGSDARILSVLGTVTFYEAYYEQDTPIDIANYICDSFAVDQIASELADAAVEYYLAFENEKAVGYLKLLTGSTADGIDEPGEGFEVKRIYTLERVWGKGIGDKLIDFCKETARGRGLRFIWLGVWEENARALRFYEKHGFVEVGTVTFPYGTTVGINKVMKLDV